MATTTRMNAMPSTTPEALGYTLHPLSNSMFQQGGIVIPDKSGEDGESEDEEEEEEEGDAGGSGGAGMVVEEDGGGGVSHPTQSKKKKKQAVRVRFYQLDEAHCKGASY
jgi:hypothetical protein